MNDISLRLLVNTDDAKNISRWLKDKEVTQYLNEDINSADRLEEVINSNKSNLLTYYLNQDGRFFLIDHSKSPCVGFINLFTVIPNKEYEIVVVIGDPINWNKQYAYHALNEIMREVFFKWRINKLKAKIHKDNQRSIKLFNKLLFEKEKEGKEFYTFEMSFNRYLSLL